MFRKIIRCPMSFFDVTPIGRLLNRFSKDMDEGLTLVLCLIIVYQLYSLVVSANYHSNLCHGGYVFACVRQFVCLFVHL